MAGVSAGEYPPSSAILALISGVFTTFLIAAYNLLITSGGVLAGAKTPNHAVTSKSLKPDSIMVGTSGNSWLRVRPVTAKAFNFPDLM